VLTEQQTNQNGSVFSRSDKMSFKPQDRLATPKLPDDNDTKEGYYTKHNITSADTTGKYESSNPGDPYNQEMMWIWNTYHNLKKDHGFKYLYYDPKPLTAKDIRNIYKQVLPK